MKTPKSYYPIIAAASLIAIGLVPISLGDERLQIQPIEAFPKAVSVEADPIKRLINAEVVNPLIQSAFLRSSFSRMGPTESTTYQLAETTSKGAKGIRTFTVVRKITPLHRKDKNPKSQSTNYLKLRHLANTEQLQVDLKGKWVSLSDHPILKSLAKLPSHSKITP